MLPKKDQFVSKLICHLEFLMVTSYLSHVLHFYRFEIWQSGETGQTFAKKIYLGGEGKEGVFGLEKRRLYGNKRVFHIQKVVKSKLIWGCLQPMEINKEKLGFFFFCSKQKCGFCTSTNIPMVSVMKHGRQLFFDFIIAPLLKIFKNWTKVSNML